ncbi:hypothetical protein Bpfe_015423 [Biomphalaria pfeifferi]|uniref:Uncharacterized protein n=1 Tax=Biomphalaria pfeifferi TaxID=112525 RepID=A0AAD8BJ81_BIOPF|nr:hypothetical protein Bpfe_015423 [Biomphalaria pfeifferi]
MEFRSVELRDNVGVAGLDVDVVDNKIRRHMTEMQNFCRKITRSWHLIALYLDTKFSIDAAGKKRPVQDSTERPSMVKKFRPEGDVEATEGPGNTEQHCACCCRKAISHVMVCIDKVKAIVDSPENLLSILTDCFGQTLDTEDLILKALRNVTIDEVFIEITKELAEGFCKVLQRQYFN